MIHRLIELSLRNRGLVVVLYIGLALWGYWALLRTPDVEHDDEPPVAQG